MFYIIDEWLNDKNNIDKVYDILNKYFYIDVVLEDPKILYEKAYDELKAIGEEQVLEKIN